jgi:cyclopropane fatty-acyl-phospholipid synthase-like methyltransferase
VTNEHPSNKANKSKENWCRDWRDPAFSPAWWVDGPHKLIRVAVERGWLPPGCSILEIGCGAGQQARWLSQQGFRVVGFDFSPEAIERACRDSVTLSGLQFVEADVTSDEWPDPIKGSFDAIIDAGCFHIIPCDQHERYFRNVISWSRIGTRFLLMIAYPDLEEVQQADHIRMLFQPSFDEIFCEKALGCLPRRPNLNLMVFGLQRRC